MVKYMTKNTLKYGDKREVNNVVNKVIKISKLFCHYKVSPSQKVEFPTDFTLYRLLSCKAVFTIPQIFRIIHVYRIFLSGMTGQWYYLINSHKYMYMIIYLIQ